MRESQYLPGTNEMKEPGSCLSLYDLTGSPEEVVAEIYKTRDWMLHHKVHSGDIGKCRIEITSESREYESHEYDDSDELVFWLIRPATEQEKNRYFEKQAESRKRSEVYEREQLAQLTRKYGNPTT